MAKSPLDEWMYLLKNSSIKSNFKAKGIKEAGRTLDMMKMTKEERQRYERYLDLRMSAKSQYFTALTKGEKIGQLKLLSSQIKQGFFTNEQAAQQMNMTVEEFAKALKKYLDFKEE